MKGDDLAPEGLIQPAKATTCVGGPKLTRRCIDEVIHRVYWQLLDFGVVSLVTIVLMCMTLKRLEHGPNLVEDGYVQVCDIVFTAVIIALGVTTAALRARRVYADAGAREAAACLWHTLSMWALGPLWAWGAWQTLSHTDATTCVQYTTLFIYVQTMICFTLILVVHLCHDALDEVAAKSTNETLTGGEQLLSARAAYGLGEAPPLRRHDSVWIWDESRPKAAGKKPFNFNLSCASVPSSTVSCPSSRLETSIAGRARASTSVSTRPTPGTSDADSVPTPPTSTT